MVDNAQPPRTYPGSGGSPVPGLILQHVLRGHTGPINRPAWSPAGRLLATPAEDGTVRLWDALCGSCLLTLAGPAVNVISAAWSPDGLRLAAGGAQGAIQLWDTSSGQRLESLTVSREPVTCLVW